MRLGSKNNCEWLPDLVPFVNGNWEKYVDIIYRYFENDFIKSKPLYRGMDVNHRHFPEDNEHRHAAFWHLIQEGKDEENRVPNFRRCERIRWPKPIIEYGAEDVILVWESDRKGKTNICLFFENKDYLVVLGKRSGYVLLLTAYPIEYANRKEKLLKEYRTYHNI